MMELINIDHETCSQCGRCAADCPSGIIYFRERGYPRSIKKAESFCVQCGHCVAVCPSGSLDHRDVPLAESIKLEKGLNITPEQCEQLIKGRRSIRNYRDQPVPRETITRLIDVARYAPTGRNNQEVQWLVLDNREQLRYLEDIGVEYFVTMLEQEPEMAAEMHMARALKRHERKPATFLRGAPALVVTHAPEGMVSQIDCVIALSYFNLAADSLGLGCCWAGWILTMANSFEPMMQALAVPEGNTVGGCMMLGYPAYSHNIIPKRRPAQITWRG